MTSRELQNLPSFVINFARRFLTGAYETPSSALEDGKLERDAFGFRKLIVGASAYGKVLYSPFRSAIYRCLHIYWIGVRT